MRGSMMMAGSVVALFVFSLVPAHAPFLAQGPPQQQEPARPEQVPPENPPLSERQKMELRGDLHMARKQYPEAVGVYLTIFQDEPKNAALANKIGIAYHQMTKLDQAKKYYQRAVKADKNFAAAVNNLGTIEYNRKKYRAAIKHYRRALELAPNLATTHSNLGYALFAQKKYDEALASFQRALELDPEIFEHRSALGSVLQDRSVADRGLFYFFLAKTFAQQGNAERCAHYLRRARDEGYKGLTTVSADPAFSLVVNDPLVQEVLNPGAPLATAPPPKPEP